MRIRSIKPEFWRSPDISVLTIPDRLLFIGLWSYVDDNGVGRDRLADICADLFAPDLEVDPREVFGRVQGGLRELSGRGLIHRYEADGKPYLAIATWKSHQRIDKPSAGRFPPPTREDIAIAEPSRSTPVALPEGSTPGAGEQGNRGTGEVGAGEQEKPSSSEIASDLDAHPRAEVIELCEYLAARVRTNGHKANPGKAWHRQCRLLLDVDRREPEQVRAAIDWATGDSFWSANIRSMATLREKYSTLQAQASRPAGKSRRQQETDDWFARSLARAEAADAAEAAGNTIKGAIA
ncbi:MAG: hypothetical protein H7Z19_04960 [Chitinophagaceae bacterium]|nr:hypothetical protein [Rubrivivax sp.]